MDEGRLSDDNIQAKCLHRFGQFMPQISSYAINPCSWKMFQAQEAIGGVMIPKNAVEREAVEDSMKVENTDKTSRVELLSEP